MKIAIIKTYRESRGVEELQLSMFGRMKHLRNGLTEIYDDCEELSVVIKTNEIQSIVIGVVNQ